MVLAQAWFSLSFGIEQVHGLIDLQEMQPVMPELPSGITIRRAGAGDGPTVAGFFDLIWKVQVQSPVWGVMLPEATAETAEGWAELAQHKPVSFPVLATTRLPACCVPSGKTGRSAHRLGWWTLMKRIV